MDGMYMDIIENPVREGPDVFCDGNTRLYVDCPIHNR